MRSLKTTRKQKGFTQRKLAKQIGVRPDVICNIESSRHAPDNETRRKIELVLGEKINWLDTKIINVRTLSSTWNETERIFRHLLKKLWSLPVDEQKTFITSASRHLRSLK